MFRITRKPSILIAVTQLLISFFGCDSYSRFLLWHNLHRVKFQCLSPCWIGSVLPHAMVMKQSLVSLIFPFSSFPPSSCWIFQMRQVTPSQRFRLWKTESMLRQQLVCCVRDQVYGHRWFFGRSQRRWSLCWNCFVLIYYTIETACIQITSLSFASVLTVWRGFVCRDTDLGMSLLTGQWLVKLVHGCVEISDVRFIFWWSNVMIGESMSCVRIAAAENFYGLIIIMMWSWLTIEVMQPPLSIYGNVHF